MSDLRYAALYQINSRVWLTELSRALGKPATLDDIPDAVQKVGAGGILCLTGVGEGGPAPAMPWPTSSPSWS